MLNKKVLEVVEAFGGGIFTMINELTNGLSDEYEIVIVYSKRKETPQDFKKMFNDNIRFIEVENFTREINPKKDIKALKELKKIIKNEKPDIIHLHSSKAGVLGRLSASGKKYKMFYNPHGFSFLKQDDSKIKRFCYRTIEKIMSILNPKCKIIGCSEGEYEEALKISKNSTCINNGIDIKNIEKDIEKLKEHKIYFEDLKICTVGRIGYQKNPTLFNEIAKSLPRLQFTWIGDGDLKHELTSNNIEITGWQKREDVLKKLNESDIFILPSLWEGLPIALLEAMYLEKICIVSDVVGNKNVIINEKNGFVCDELTDYVKTIEKIPSGQYNIADIISNAKKDIKEEYNIEVMRKKYLKLYN